MPSVLRSVAVFGFVAALAMLSAPGCSQQGQGERCDSAKNGDLDCDSGLTCTKKAQLLEGITDRCCPAEGSETDKRCTHGVAPTMGSSGSGTGGSSGNAGTAATAGSAGTSAEAASGASGNPATDTGGQGGSG